MPKRKKRFIVVLHERKLGAIGNFIMKMREIALMVGNEPLLYPTPVPSISTFQLHINELVDAETVAERHTTGSAAERDIKYNLVRNDVHNLQNYIQTLVDNAATEDDAVILIINAGFEVKKYGVRVRPDFEVRKTNISGTVKLIAKRAAKISSNKWEMSYDNNTWISLPITEQAKTFVKGLKPGRIVYFRHCPVVKSGEGNWSQTVSICIT
jgi:hypothetical protein